jgi:hypothetical protein
METLVVEKKALKEQMYKVPIVRPIVKKKMTFKEAVAECDGRPVSEFFDELRRQVKEHFNNA